MSFYTSDGIFVDDNNDDEVVIYRPTGRFMTIEDTKLVDKKQLPKLKPDNLILKKDEYCCFIGDAKTYKSKTITTGYVSNRQGGSVRITKGLSYHSGTGKSQVVREIQTTIYNGIIYITNKRVIYISQGGDNFDKPIEKLTYVDELQDGVMIQIGSKSYSIEMENHVLFMMIFNLVKHIEFGAELPEIYSNSNVQYTIDPIVMKKQKKPLSYYIDNIMKPIRAFSSLPGKTKWYIFIGICIALIFILPKISNLQNQDPAVIQQRLEQEKIYTSSMIQQFIGIGFSENQAQNAVNILRKIGINKITNMEQKENTFNSIGSDDSYPKQEETNIVYLCTGTDDSPYECKFLLFIKDNEIIHASYYGYGTKTIYYKKGRTTIRKTVHPYVNN